MKIDIKEEFEIENGENHCINCTGTFSVDGVAVGTAYVQHYGLSACGEAYYGEVCFDKIPKWLQEKCGEAVRDFAHLAITKMWNYDGSNWSEPVDEPETELVDEADENHQWEVSRTEFHGGETVGFAESEEMANKWISFKIQNTNCVCGCYKISTVEEVR